MKDFEFIKKLILEQKIIFAILALMFLNFAVVDYLLVSGKFSKPQTLQVQKPAKDSCGSLCREEITKRINELRATLPSPSPLTQTVVQQVSSSNNNVDVYIPLGTGTSSSTSFAFVPGTQAYINSSQYSNASQITFEASVSVPNANQDVYLQLFDVTAGHIVWNSGLLSHSGSTGNLMVSSPIKLDPGNNLYQVQMKTQVGATTNVTQSQIHVRLQ